MKNPASRTITRFFLFGWCAALAACSTDSGTIVYRGGGLPPGPEAEPSGEPEETSTETPESIRRAMVIADILYDAKLAYDDNRLMQPAGDNAYDRYREALGYEPDNEVAREGIREIVQRYVQLADNAMGIGQYDEAEGLLDRAASIGNAGNVVEAARQRLEEARKTRIEYFALDPDGLARQSLEVMVELGQIAQTLTSENARFLITARTDAEGRWIYKVMREAVGGYRLRGNIALGEEPGVQVEIPSS